MSDFIAVGGSKAPAIKLNQDGAFAHGVIVSLDQSQERDFQTKQPKFFSDGNPIMQYVIEVQDANGTLGTVYAGSGLKKSINAAVKASGAAGLRKGDTLSVRFAGKQVNERGQYVNTYETVYQPAMSA